MTMRQPPRVAVWLLDRFAPDDEPLAGDLLEEFQFRQSRLWFWRQTLAAVWMASLHRPVPTRPLRLVEREFGSETALSPKPRRRAVNLSASPVAGVGGLGLVALTFVITAVSPLSWLILLAGALLGVLAGALSILVTRRKAHPGVGPDILFGGGAECRQSAHGSKERG